VELSVIEEPETGTPNDALLTRLDGAFSGDVIWAFPRVHDLPRLAAIGWFEGAVEGCGSGGVGMAIVADDSGTVRWEVLRGTGTLDLERLTAVGVGDWDLGSASGTLSVGVTCVDESDPLDSRTTLVGLAPTVDAPPGPAEALYGMGPGDTTRLRLDPTVLAGYPGITFNDVSVQPDSFVPGFETAHVEAILTSPAFSGVGSMNVGVLWQRWTSDQSCPGGKVQLLVGRNWPAGSGFTLAWHTVPDLSCGDAVSGAWEPWP
jgi:hypothetical protein